MYFLFRRSWGLVFILGSDNKKCIFSDYLEFKRAILTILPLVLPKKIYIANAVLKVTVSLHIFFGVFEKSFLTPVLC